jgi:hypothetical protein
MTNKPNKKQIPKDINQLAAYIVEKSTKSTSSDQPNLQGQKNQVAKETS